MQTHYAKPKTLLSTKLINELESIVYNSIPNDSLISEEKLINRINQEIKKEHGSIVYSSREIKDTIKNLIDKKLVKEVIGSKLSKLINTK